MTWIKPGVFIKPSWHGGPYRIDRVTWCDDDNCICYCYERDCLPRLPHMHLYMSDRDGGAKRGGQNYGIGGVFADGRVISLGDDQHITQITEAEFFGKQTAQLELF